ncbi:MAG: hypothetical protein ACRDK8_14645 [Solirubrobacteraceae bacterium]
MTRDEEREAIRRAVESIEQTTGSRPLGWYCREMSVNTRELVVEEGGFVYDSDCYNDDLPYWTRVLDRAHLVVPYGLVVNDARYTLAQGFGSPEHFLEMAKSHLERLRNDGDKVNRMMSVGLHPRITGNPRARVRSPGSSTMPGHSATCGSRGGSTSPTRSSSSSRRIAGSDRVYDSSSTPGRRWEGPSGVDPNSIARD